MKTLIAVVMILVNFSTIHAKEISIGERINFSSKILNENRELLIYTPPSYNYNDKTTYPVMYFVDADYNFHYVTGLIELLSSVSSNIPEMIVVGIVGKGTTTYRKQSKPPYDVKDKGTADKTLAFIQKELFPFINKNYKTNNYKILSGHSIGGLFTTYAMITQTDMVDTFIAISPSLWWEDEAVRKHTEKDFANKKQLNTNYYISLANEKGMGVHGFLEVLQSKGPRSLNLKFMHFPNESHGSVGLDVYKWALKDLFADFRLEEGYFKNAVAIEKYFIRIKEKYKTNLHIPSGYLRSTAYAYSKDTKQRKSIKQALEKFFPGQLDEFRNIEISGLIESKRLKEVGEILKAALKNDNNNYETLNNHALYLLEKDKVKNQEIAKDSIEKAIGIAKDKNIRQWQLNELLETQEKIKANTKDSP